MIPTDNHRCRGEGCAAAFRCQRYRPDERGDAPYAAWDMRDTVPCDGWMERAETKKYPHPPGDPQAVTDECACPVMDNAHGKGCGYADGDGWPLYVSNLKCPLHGGSRTEEDRK